MARISEIQRNFKKIQRDIESKKSELRTMVGERYRELINTADTIAEMENTVKDIRTTLTSIQTSCKLGTAFSNCKLKIVSRQSVDISFIERFLISI